MKVLVVPKWYPWPDRPVLGSFCREHARALATRHEVVVLASDAVRRPGFALFSLSDAVEAGLRTIRVRYRRPAFRPAAMACQLCGMLVALWRLRREGWRPDVVHAHVYSAGLPALVLARLSRARMVLSEHYTGFPRGLVTGYDRLLARLVFARADLVAPVSRDLAGYVQALAPRARVHVVPNTVDAAVFHPRAEAGRRSRRPPDARLLTVAALAAKKGHADLLEALAALSRQREITLDLVGDGEQLASLQRQVDRLGLGGAVRFHGELSKQEVAQLMREADLFVLPSHAENLPVVLIEAMASGLPFVATAVGGVPELLEHEAGAGTLCAPRDPEALACAISRALDARDSIDRLALAERACRRFGYAALADAWTTIYRALER
jgi:glycosyltransferase involved in cell wall biosynthesis